MTSDYKRYAIYWVPRVGTDLAAFGRGWTGWCAEQASNGKDEAAQALIKGHPGTLWQTCLHGLHAPICHPFRMKPRGAQWRLDKILQRVAASVRPIPLPRFQVTVRRGQVVLALERPCEQLEALQGLVTDAARLVSRRRRPRPAGVRKFATAGIALPSDEVHPAPLVTPFHMPLTGEIEASAAYDLAADLYPQLSQILALPQRVSDIALMGDPGGGRPWRLVERYRLVGTGTYASGPMPDGMICPDTRPMPPLAALLGSGWQTVI